MTAALRSIGDTVDLFLMGEVEGVADDRPFISLGSTRDPLTKRFVSSRRAFSSFFRGPYDVINIHFALNALPLIPFIAHDTPRVVHFHGPWAAEAEAEGASAMNAAAKRILEWFIYRRVDRFIVLSGAFRDILTQYGVRYEHIHVIPMGIDVEFFRPAEDRNVVRQKLGWPLDATIFFTARRLINRVGLIELLHAMKIISDSNPNILLKIAGKGPLRGELEAAIVSFGLVKQVQLVGFLSEEQLAEAFQAADATAVPSQCLEGFGTIISESLACGTPVIVTPVGGMPEIVSPFSSELIARSTSPVDIAERMTLFISGDVHIPSRSACRAYAVKLYGWPIVVQQVRNVFVA